MAVGVQMKFALVFLTVGTGSRYDGLKQISIEFSEGYMNNEQL
jgi:hypothetical protein